MLSDTCAIKRKPATRTNQIGNGKAHYKGGSHDESRGERYDDLCMGLETAEQEKVERLDEPISQRFIRAGWVSRICQGSGIGTERVLNFCGPSGAVGTIRAADFLAASDHDAVAHGRGGDSLITCSSSNRSPR